MEHSLIWEHIKVNYRYTTGGYLRDFSNICFQYSILPYADMNQNRYLVFLTQRFPFSFEQNDTLIYDRQDWTRIVPLSSFLKVRQRYSNAC